MRGSRWRRPTGTCTRLSTSSSCGLRVSPVSPGSTHDITAARAFVLPAIYPAAAAGLPILTDAGYQGADIGIWHPLRLPTNPHRLTEITAAALVLLHLQRGTRRSRW